MKISKPLLAGSCIYSTADAGRVSKIVKPLYSGSCIYSEKDAAKAVQRGSGAISVGAVAVLRPWRVGKLVKFMSRRK